LPSKFVDGFVDLHAASDRQQQRLLPPNNLALPLHRSLQI
jgi:hypothetical protein